MSCPSQYLWSHVVWSALQGLTLLGNVLERVAALLDAFGCTEIGYLESTVLHDEDVGTFQVTMYDILPVEIRQTFQNLSCHSRGFCLAQYSCLVDVTLKTALLRVLENYLDLLVVFRDIETIVLDDVGMVKLPEHPDLSF